MGRANLPLVVGKPAGAGQEPRILEARLVSADHRCRLRLSGALEGDPNARCRSSAFRPLNSGGRSCCNGAGERVQQSGGDASAGMVCPRGKRAAMTISVELAINAVIAGVLLGGFYAAVTVGVTISFGMLDIVNIAHPAFIMLGSFVAYILNSSFGLDPILIGVLMLPPFFVIGMGVYQIYFYSFEQRNEESIQGLAFFFGLLFVGEVGLVLIFGVDYRFVTAPYIGPSLHLGFAELPLRMLVPFAAALVMIAALQLVLGRTFIGRAILAVSQDRLALQLMAADPGRIKRIAFGISIATAALAGALLIIIQPVEPSIGRDYIGRIFAICVLGGMTSFPGMVAGAMLIGIAESLTATFYGPSWAPAVAFGFLLLTLAWRPAGILGR
jgi:branched-chain amino acid transport system permease protein